MLNPFMFGTLYQAFLLGVGCCFGQGSSHVLSRLPGKQGLHTAACDCSSDSCRMTRKNEQALIRSAITACAKFFSYLLSLMFGIYLHQRFSLTSSCVSLKYPPPRWLTLSSSGDWQFVPDDVSNFSNLNKRDLQKQKHIHVSLEPC